MQKVEENFSLKSLNTFGIEASARFYTMVESVAMIRETVAWEQLKKPARLVMGGGSNLLFTGDFDGLVIHNRIRGIEVVREDGRDVYVRSGAGEVWHHLVLYCIERGYAGIENLSLIPGSVGAGPIQNIGAYGVELKDVFYELEAIDLGTGEARTFSHADCRFGYRDSIFKKEWRGRYIIASVVLKLSKVPSFNTSYGAIENELKAMGVTQLSIKAISQAVCNIRRSKLPDPAQIGNAGSFFKNPEIPKPVYDELKKKFPDMVAYPAVSGMKLAAGWLIEQCGWKGKTIGKAGVHRNQALVLVNYGGARGREVVDIARAIQRSVKDKFGVDLEAEVNIV